MNLAPGSWTACSVAVNRSFLVAGKFTVKLGGTDAHSHSGLEMSNIDGRY